MRRFSLGWAVGLVRGSEGGPRVVGLGITASVTVRYILSRFSSVRLISPNPLLHME